MKGWMDGLPGMNGQEAGKLSKSIYVLWNGSGQSSLSPAQYPLQQ